MDSKLESHEPNLAALAPDAPLAALLPALLAVWRARRTPEIGDLAEAVTTALLLESPRPALGASRKAAERQAWREVEAARDPLDFPRLVAAARGGAQDEVKAQVLALLTWDHPGMARGLLAILESPPYAGIKSRPLIEVILEGLRATRDARCAAPARALAKRYLTIVNSSTGGFILDQLEGIADVIAGLPSPELAPSEQAFVEAVLARLPPEARPAPPPAEPEGPSIDELFALVYASPDDDAPRLVLADALLLRGDERGELINLQLAERRGPLDAAARARLAELSTPGRLAAWALPLSKAGQCSFERGFPHAITLYSKGASTTFGDVAWTTIRKIAEIEKLSKKATVELLDHPTLAGVREISALSAAALAALDSRPRGWTGLTLLAEAGADVRLAQRCPSLERLAVRLSGASERAPETMLEGLPRLVELDLRYFGNDSAGRVRVPPTVRRMSSHGLVADGVFQGATQLRALTFWTPEVRRGQLVGLESLEDLDVRARRFEPDPFAPLEGLRSLTVGLERERRIAPALLAPLSKLRRLDLTYLHCERAHVEHLAELEELRDWWVNVADVPPLPRLASFHAMLPVEVDDIAALLERIPSLRSLAFCFNSQSSLWFTSGRAAKAWERLREIVAGSSLTSFSIDGGVELTRDEGGEWSRLSLRHARLDGYVNLDLYRYLVAHFPVRAVVDAPDEMRATIEAMIAKR